MHVVAVVRRQPHEVRGRGGRTQITQERRIRARVGTGRDDARTAGRGVSDVAVVLEGVVANHVVPGIRISVGAVARVRRHVLHVGLPRKGRVRPFEEIDEVLRRPCRIRARVGMRGAVVVGTSEICSAGNCEIVWKTGIHVAVVIVAGDGVLVRETRHVSRRTRRIARRIVSVEIA